MPCYVYRFFDREDGLLYVGSTSNFKKRVSGHKRRKWWKYVDRFTLEECADRASAYSYERQVIQNECPRFNRDRYVRPKQGWDGASDYGSTLALPKGWNDPPKQKRRKNPTYKLF